MLDKQIKVTKYLIKTNGGESELLPLLEELKQRRDNEKVLRGALVKITNNYSIRACQKNAKQAL